MVKFHKRCLYIYFNFFPNFIKIGTYFRAVLGLEGYKIDMGYNKHWVYLFSFRGLNTKKSPFSLEVNDGITGYFYVNAFNDNSREIFL